MRLLTVVIGLEWLIHCTFWVPFRWGRGVDYSVLLHTWVADHHVENESVLFMHTSLCDHAIILPGAGPE